MRKPRLISGVGRGALARATANPEGGDLIRESGGWPQGATVAGRSRKKQWRAGDLFQSTEQSASRALSTAHRIGTLCSLANLFAEAANEVMTAPHAALAVRKANLISVNMKRVIASRSAEAAAEPGARSVYSREIWWAHQDLNLEPTDYESAALTN
jgi:hypothetical protein